MTRATDAYRRLAERAEAAVSSMKDRALRQAAFERILQRLLDDESSEPARAQRDDSRGSPRSRVSAKKAASSASVEPTTPGRIRRHREPGKRHGGEGAIFLKWIAEGFFDTARTFSEVLDHFHRQGHIIKSTSLPGYLLGGVRSGYLKRDKKMVGGRRQYVYAAVRKR